jgi:hypothetical protein
VRQTTRTNTISFLYGTLVTCLFCFVAPAIGYGQYDTTKVTEEVIPNEETDTDEEEGTGFLEKWETDSFTVKERKLSPGFSDSLKKDGDFWYADAELKKKEEKKKKSNDKYVPISERSWFQFLLWLIIIGGFAGAIMWYLVDSNVGFFRKKDTKTGSDTGTDEIPEDIFAINYQREIDKAAGKGNYRLAVRLMYLRLLKEMSDKNIIQYKQDRTNFDYLMQLSVTRYYDLFFRLTRHYEYSWYGHFDVEETKYRIIAAEFSRFEKELRFT